jgi:CelD/BcsL family acetyltransferase involved in cellulose biosynthesis
MNKASEYSFTRLTAIESFEALAEAWQALMGRAQLDNIFLTHEWLCEWWRVYGASYMLWTLVAEQAGRIVGIAPLTLTRLPDGTRQLLFMGDSELTPNHLDLIVGGEHHAALVEGLVDYLWQQRAEWDILHLDNLPAESPTRARLQAALRARGLWTHSALTARCPYAVLPASFDAFTQRLGSKTRKQTRYAQRALLRDYPTARFGRVENEAELTTAFETMVRLHRARWQRLGEADAFASAQFVAFHRAMARRALATGVLQLYYLKIDGAFAAIYYCYRVGSRLMYYNAGFDERWAKYSVGVLLLAHTIEQAILADAREYDFLQGEEGYKSHWANAVRDNWCVRAASVSWRARLKWLRAYWLREQWKAIKQPVKRLKTRLTIVNKS